MDYSLTEIDNNKTIYAVVNDTATIVLKSNPSTGFMWQQVNTSAGKLLEVKYGPASKIPGRPVDVKFVFSLQQNGILLLSYSRPWEESEPPEKWFQIGVEIK